MSVGWGQDCDDGVEVELWDECYNIEETENLDLSYSELTGQIPPEIGDLTNLTELYLDYNQLTGEIPESVGNLMNLTYFSLPSNELTSLPESIVNLTNLTYLDLSNNQLSTLPESICNLPSDCVINLFNNHLCDEEYYYCIDILNIDEQDCTPCQLGEEGYTEINGECYYQSDLNPCLLGEEGYTEINGECYYQSDLDVLQDFIDMNESLSGFEPLGIGSQFWESGGGGRLYYLSLQNNQLTILPESIGNLNLIYFYLQDNQLTTLPVNIGNFYGKDLVLSYNQLTTLPESICNIFIPSLELFDISNNNLCPPYYPECIEPYVGYQDTSECEECNGLPGDINEDGDIDVLDIVIMVDCILIDNCDECSDITNDGETNVLDIVYLVDYILN